MNLTTQAVSLTNPRQGKLAPAAEPKLVLEWQDGPATDLGFRQQKLRLSFARGPLQASVNLREIKHGGTLGRSAPAVIKQHALWAVRLLEPATSH